MRACLLTLLLALALCACGSPAPPPEEPPAPAQPEAHALSPGERDLLAGLVLGRVPRSEAVDPSWFDDAAFVGDSVSVMLEYYNNAHHTLGHPAFLCAESLSPRNAMNARPGSERLPEWPKGSGRRPTLPEAVAESGAKKLYVMLGMNAISGGVDNARDDLVTLIGSIQEKSPDLVILVQGVTPMTADSPRADEVLNNGTIRLYDLALAQVCREKGWYYLDVSQALADETGCLRADYSGDKAMGIHLNFDGAAAWADYLLTHVPEDLREGASDHIKS